MYNDSVVHAIAWSPCNRFTAIARFNSNVVQLLDAATLGLLDVFQPPSNWLGGRPLLSFSPDSRSLTLHVNGRIITWDLQTGGKAADLPARWEGGSSSTYSIDGRSFALLSNDHFETPSHITTYDLLLGTCTGHFRASTGSVARPIWTHGGCIRFVTAKNRSITISEVGFTSAHAPVEVETFPAPDRVGRARDYLFLPALLRLAFILPEAIEVWDAQHSRTLLERTGNNTSMMSFSTDGHFFAYAAKSGQEVHMWKESATGYEFHQRLPSTLLTLENLVLSPSGRSIIMTSQSIYLLSTADPILSLSSNSTQFAQWTSSTLAFSPDESLAAIAPNLGNTITVVNLKSGDQRLVIETGMMTLALGMIESTLIAVGDGKVVAWTVPTTGDHVFNARANINDSVRTTILDQPGLPSGDLFGSALTSPGRNRVAIAGGPMDSGYLRIYDMSTGKYLGGTKTREARTPRFTPDGREVWVVDPPSVEGWKIVENEGSGLIELEPLGRIEGPSGVPLWRSSRGHYVHDGWVLNSARERILWLPHRWRSEERDREWGGRFLGLLHQELPEAVILELCD